MRSTSLPAFSLVELLVVVVIIALLTTILVPAVGRALSEAELVKCRANLKSLGLCLTLYADANSQDFPVSEYLHNPHTELIAAASSYVQEPRILYCPSKKNTADSYTPENFADGNIGYFYYSCQKRPSNLGTAMFLRRVISYPRHLSATSPPGSWLAGDIWFSGQPTGHFWFKRGINYLTTDQAVGFVPDSPRATFK